MSDEKIQGIYVIQNTRTLKSYVGQSDDCIARIRKHRKDLDSKTHTNYKLQKAWDSFVKNSIENKNQGELENKDQGEFIARIVERVEDAKRLDEREDFWMDRLDSCRQGYNIRLQNRYRSLAKKLPPTTPAHVVPAIEHQPDEVDVSFEHVRLPWWKRLFG